MRRDLYLVDSGTTHEQQCPHNDRVPLRRVCQHFSFYIQGKPRVVRDCFGRHLHGGKIPGRGSLHPLGKEIWAEVLPGLGDVRDFYRQQPGLNSLNRVSIRQDKRLNLIIYLSIKCLRSVKIPEWLWSLLLLLDGLVSGVGDPEERCQGVRGLL